MKFKILILLLFLLTFHASTFAMPEPVQMKATSLPQIEKMALAAKDSLEGQARKENHPVKLYLHWSAGHYGALYNAYHINIDADGSIYASTEDLSENKPHTYMRNNGSIGISLACGFGAKPKALGAEPPTKQQIQAMAEVIAVLARALNIPIDKQHVLTHGEAGDNEDGIFPAYGNNGRPYGMYGPFHGAERWDLAILQDGDPWLSGGNTLRLKAIFASMRLNRAMKI